MIKYADGVLTIQEKGDKIRITKGQRSYTCNMQKDEFVLPLPYGDGTYSIVIYSRIINNKYSILKKQSIKATQTDKYLLNFNLYVPHTSAADYAITLCEEKNQLESYQAITNYVKKKVNYDYIKAILMSKKTGVLPAPQECWDNRRGICQDIASMVVGMLRAVGIKARLAIGYVGRNYHAWVEAYIDNKEYRFDYNNPKNTGTYTIERWY